MLTSGRIRGRTIAVWLLAALALSCGGGGGGTPANLASVNPSPLDLEAFVGTTSPSASLTLTFGGDLDWLYQQHLYIWILYPEAVFGTEVDLYAGPDPSTQLTAALHGVDGLSQGSHSGDLEVHVCLDSACRSELAGSPTVVHYSIDILHGLELPQPSLTESQPFGTHLIRRLAVTLPTGAGTGGTMGLAVDGGGFADGWSAHVAADDPSSVDVVFPLREVGHTSHTFRITASAPDPARTGAVVPFEAFLDVSYDVTPNPGVPFATTETQFPYTRAAGDCMPGYGDFYVVLQDPGDTATVTYAFEYLSNPAAADGLPGVHGWLQALSAVDIAFEVLACPPPSGQELPPGSYRAVIHVTHPNGGSPYRIDVPVSLDVDS